MRGTGRTLCAAAALAELAGAAAAEGLQAGARVLIRAEGREDYTPRVVRCAAPTGLCIRDTRGTQPENPVEETAEGWRVDFASWGVVYHFRPGGTGVVTDAAGAELGPFRWSQ